MNVIHGIILNRIHIETGKKNIFCVVLTSVVLARDKRDVKVHAVLIEYLLYYQPVEIILFG